MWICPICSSSNEDSEERCVVCGAENESAGAVVSPISTDTADLERARARVGGIVSTDEAAEKMTDEDKLALARSRVSGLFASASTAGKEVSDSTDTGASRSAVSTFGEYSRMAKDGDASATYHVGECYFYGRGVAQDREKAFEYFRKAANMGHLAAYYDLAVCYEHGYGVGASAFAALVWYGKGAEGGDERARAALSRLKGE